MKKSNKNKFHILTKLSNKIKLGIERLSKKQKKAIHILILSSLCIIPLLTTTGCFNESKFGCELCGDSYTYTPIYSQGSINNTEYKSCLCPAGVLGIGTGCSLFPTECLEISNPDGIANSNKGTVYYYDEPGCIADNNGTSFSKGKYIKGCTILNFSVSTDEYREDNTKDKQNATQQSTCLGCAIDERSAVFLNANDTLPRQYPKGIFSSCDDSLSEAISEELE